MVVLERPHREGEGVEGIVTAKWKVAAEFQPGTVLALRETLSAVCWPAARTPDSPSSRGRVVAPDLAATHAFARRIAASVQVAAHVEEHGAAAVAALPVGLLPTLQALLRVATAELSATFRAQTLVHRQGKYGDRSKADGAAQRQQQQRKGASGPPQEVLCALESALTKFDALPAKFEAGEVPTTVIATLLREMQADLGRRPASLQRRAEKVVAAHVGREYAAWRAASSSAAA